MGYYVKNRRLQSGSSGVVLPAGGSATRPLAPSFGLLRYNTDIASVEFFNGTQFVTLSQSGSLAYTVDTFTGNGVTTTFTMSIAESQAAQIIVFVGAIYQEPTVYSVNGGFDITFSQAPPGGVDINVIHSTN